MGTRAEHELSFEVEKVIQPIYTGGDAVVDGSGKIFAACVGEDALITDLTSGETLCRIEGDGEAITSLQLCPDASHVILCSRSLSLRIYRLQAQDTSNELQATLLKALKPHNTPVVTSAVDETSTLLATGSADGAVKVWDIRGGFATHNFRGHSGIVSALRFFELPERSSHSDFQKRSSNSKASQASHPSQEEETSARFRLASGGDDGQIKIWSLAKRKAVASLSSHVSVVRGLDYSCEQNALVSSSRDKTFILWDASTWKTRKVVPALEVLEDSVFVDNGRYICTGGENGSVRVWLTDTCREVTREQDAGGDADTLLRLLIPRNSHELISVQAEQTLGVYDVRYLESLSSEAHIDELPLIRRISGTHDEVIDLAYVTPRQQLMALATNSENVRLVSVSEFHAGADQQAAYFGSDVGLLQGHEDIVICLDTDWSGCWLATGAKDNTAKLWRLDVEKNEFSCFATFTGHTESLGAISLSKTVPQAGSAAYSDPLNHPPAFLITGSQDKTIKRWATRTGKSGSKGAKAMYTRLAHEKDINAISVNYNGTLFATASQDRTIKIWSVEEGETQALLKGHKRGVWSIAFGPKDLPNIIGDDNGQSTSGRGVLLSGSGDKTVKIWSLSDYTCLRTFEGHTNTVLKVIWLPARPENRGSDEMEEGSSHRKQSDQAAIAVSAGSDGLVRLWDGQSGEPVSTLDNHTDRIWALAANSTSGTLVSGGADSVVTFWKDTTATSAVARANAATERVEQEQALSNHIHRGNYREAIVLALTLNHPGRLLALFTTIAKQAPEEGSLTGLKAVDEVLANLSDDQLFTLLLRLRDWNTNARNAAVTQKVLNAVIKSYPRERIVDLGKGRGRRGLGDVLEALRAYTERHYKRTEELLEESYIVDFVVRGMGEEGFVEDKARSSTDRDIVMAS